jgi:hypothetical protein
MSYFQGSQSGPFYVKFHENNIYFPHNLIHFTKKNKNTDYFLFTIDLLHIPDLILKLQVFTRVISLTTETMVFGLGIAMERMTNLSVIFS